MTEATELLTGRVSTVDYGAGMARVIYTDRDNAVSPPIPFLSTEYRMPTVGQLVQVLRSGARCVILGSVWSDANRPVASGADIYYKEFDNTAGRANLHYDAVTGELEIRASVLRLIEAGYASSLGELLARMGEIERRLTAVETELAEHRTQIGENKATLAEHNQRISGLGG